MTVAAKNYSQGALVGCQRWQSGAAREIEDVVSREESLSVSLEGRGEGKLWAHPIDLDRLVLGHAKLTWCGPDEKPVLVRKDESNWVFKVEPYAPVPASIKPVMTADGVVRAMTSFIGKEGLWNGTGCFHRAGVYDVPNNEFLFIAEDIGRHNCLDRLAGWAVENGRDLSGLVLFVSARLTASLMSKAMTCGFKLCVSRSAVTSAALGLACEHGATLAGFARTEDGRFTLFVDPDGRIAM